MDSRQLGLVFFPAFDWAISPTHPEREERLLYTRDQIIEEGLLDLPEIVEYKPRLASLADIEAVHIGVPDIKSLITDAHLVSAGGAMTAADIVKRQEVKRAFALVRPPGHHAMRVVHGIRGFCTINIEAIMVEYLRRAYQVRKIAIVDTDVHHGDGTQDIFYHDPDTLFISFHQDGRTLYPGTGFVDEAGSPGAFGTTINLPLPPGTSDEGLHYVLDELVLPILADFRPDMIINSAGQDNHYSDPLASMAISAQGYARLADKLKADIAVLEGGYSIEDALPYVNVGIILAMAGIDYGKVVEPDSRENKRLRAEQNRGYLTKLISYWREVWAQKESLGRELRLKSGEFWRRQRNIYYDESGISEKQVEAVRLCPQCTGYFTIDTSAEDYRHQSAFAAVITREACPVCRREAYDAVLAVKKRGGFGNYFVQDMQQNNLEKL
ncbi:hypothetical protein P22_3769 [Propionispora sp. 2/2-37]|uniref:histone deacetylase family protein n=1 Tax=Propionispora sp. 2/2-37 TaxID=1677858 RepID=UPI0006BB792E|nr:histone deacetylase [Propionispora sp. 2/2-37]CUH97637.1 hypothetical protein P22_3769 [Propionispora sp. 2/2-37]